MLINGLEALIIVGFSDSMEDLEHWPTLLRLIYLKDEEVSVAFTVGFLKSLIRDLPLEGTFAKEAMVFRQKIAFEILEREYPKDAPMSREDVVELEAMFGEIDKALQEEVDARTAERTEKDSVTDADEAEAGDSEETSGTRTES